MNLLTRLDAIVSSEFEAKLLGRVGRGHFPEITEAHVALAQGGSEFQSEWRTLYVEELAQLLGYHRRHTAATKMKTRGTPTTLSGARDVLEPLDTFQAAVCRTAVGIIGNIVLDRPDCQFAAKTVTSSTREPRKLV